MTAGWNFADIWELCAEQLGTAPALSHGPERRTWAEFDRRAGGLARFFIDAGLQRQDKVAQYLYNCNEYLESVFACLKASLVPVNTNYRYGDEELLYLWDNADAAAVVFHGSFSDRVARLRPQLEKVKAWIHVDDGSGPCPDFAIGYETVADSLGPADDPRVQLSGGRSGDDLCLLYTGGTTGWPKGVMWRQDDLFALLNASNIVSHPVDGGMPAIRESLASQSLRPVLLPACPLMHGTGLFTAFAALFLGGCVSTLRSRHFDAVELLDTVELEGVNVVTIVGDAFAAPILTALDAHRGRWDLSSLMAMISSGVMWSERTKRALLDHHKDMVLIDVFSSSEALGMGTTTSAAGSEPRTARFLLGNRARLIDDQGRQIAPGTGQVGRLAVGGRLPLGYYKDAAKTASTFVLIDGERFSVPGDYATVGEDGSLQLLGRGSQCINTGGEKVFPEEVEEVLKTHPAVRDVACVAVPDARFGEAITALVQLRAERTVDPAELVELAKAHLAHFKAPRHVLFVDTVGRSPAGKLDYTALGARALRLLGV
jgi:3-oxocholest-4-en-26-oate---CoA ligase